MAYSVKTPPKFDGLNFSIWKVKMIIFLQTFGTRVVKDNTKLFIHPDKDKDTWFEITVKEFKANAKAHYAFL